MWQNTFIYMASLHKSSTKVSLLSFFQSKRFKNIILFSFNSFSPTSHIKICLIDLYLSHYEYSKKLTISSSRSEIVYQTYILHMNNHGHMTIIAQQTHIAALAWLTTVIDLLKIWNWIFLRAWRIKPWHDPQPGELGVLNSGFKSNRDLSSLWISRSLSPFAVASFTQAMCAAVSLLSPFWATHSMHSILVTMHSILLG